jgi:hypothetical protein
VPREADDRVHRSLGHATGLRSRFGMVLRLATVLLLLSGSSEGALLVCFGGRVRRARRVSAISP